MEKIIYFIEKLNESGVMGVCTIIGGILPIMNIIFHIKQIKDNKKSILNSQYIHIGRSIKFDSRMAKHKEVLRKAKKSRILPRKRTKKNKRILISSLKDDNKSNSIVEEIYTKKIGQYNKSSSIICICIVIYYFLNIFFSTDIKIEVIIFLYALIGFTIISKVIIGYRIKKGYYGKNYEEGKEILSYLTIDKDKNDKNSGKKIYNEINQCNKAEKRVSVEGEPQY